MQPLHPRLVGLNLGLEQVYKPLNWLCSSLNPQNNSFCNLDSIRHRGQTTKHRAKMHALALFFSILPFLAQGSPIEKRSCSVVYPSFVGTIDSLDPDFVSNPLGTNTMTLALKDPEIVRPGGKKGLIMDTLVEFSNIPQGSYGCQLELFFQTGYWTVYNYPPGPTNINIWNVDKAVPFGNNYSLTWNNAPSKTSLFGNIGQVPLPPFNQDVKKVVNSGACQSKMTFRIAVPPEISQGGVQFFQSQNPAGGWRLTHNC